MLSAANRGPGANLCAPDVCYTPPPIAPRKGRPVAYTDRANHSQAVPFSPIVRICGLNALHLRSQVPITVGDDAGVNGPGPKLVGRFTTGNPIVFVDGIPGVNLTSPAMGNASNASGAMLVPDQAIVFYTHAGGAGLGGESASIDRALRAEDLLALQGSLDDAPPPVGTMLEDGIAHVRIAVFTADLSTRIYNEVRRLDAGGMRALILDLRGNPGGDLEAFLDLAGDFLPSGAILATMVDAGGDETIHRSRREHPYEMPLTLLVDRGTASAAELFAGCLQAHGRAVVAGERTYGKGSAQQVLPGRDAPGVHYATVATFTLPNGEPIEGRGVRPDVAVDARDDGRDDGRNAVLSAAIALTRATTIADRNAVLSAATIADPMAPNDP